MNFKDRLCAMNCHYRLYGLGDFFQSVHKLGTYYVELWSGPMYYYVDARRRDSPEQLEKLCDRYQIAVIGICPEQANPKPSNVAVKQKHRQEEVLNCYRQMIDVACVLGCRQVLVTSGWCYYSKAVEEARNRSVIMMKRITDYAEQRNVILALEALRPEESHLVNTIQNIRRYRNEAGGSCLKVRTGFRVMARMGYTPQEYSEASGNDIVHIHFVDGNPIGHLAWGDGSRDLKTDLAVLEEYGYQGYLSLEMATQRYYEKPWSAEMKTLKSFEE